MHRNVKLLNVFNFFLDFRPYAPLGIIYFAGETGSYLTGMSVFAITTLTAALLEVPLGILSDLVGRKITITLGALAGLAGVAFYAVGGEYLFFILGSMCTGAAGALYSGNNDAFLYDSLKQDNLEKEYPNYLGKTHSMFQLALGISALLGGFLAQVSFRMMMWASVLPQAVCLIISFFFTEVKSTREVTSPFAHLKEALAEFKRNRKLKNLTIASVISHSLSEGGYQFQGAFFESIWPLWAIGIAKTLGNFGAALSFRFSGRVIKRWGKFPVLISGKLISRFFYIIALLFVSKASPLLMAVTSLFFGTTAVAENTLFQEQFTDTQRATMGSLVSLAGSITFGIAFLLIGFMADYLGIVPAYLIVQGLMLIPVFMLRELNKTM